MSKKRSSYSSSSSVDGGGAMWLDVAEDDELVGGTKLRFTVNKMEQGKGRSKRTRYQCTLTLHGADESRVHGLGRFQKTLKADPAGSEEGEQQLRQLAMADFRRQKREQKDSGRLEDSDEEEEEEEENGACSVPCFYTFRFSIPQHT